MIVELVVAEASGHLSCVLLMFLHYMGLLDSQVGFYKLEGGIERHRGSSGILNITFIP